MAEVGFTHSDRPGSTYRLLLLLVPVLLLILWPLFVSTYPPILDYYSHLARVYITENIDDFSAFYSLNEITPPNLSFDVITRTFLGFVPVEIAGWLFLVSLILLQATGVWVLNRALQGPQQIPIGAIVGCALLYNSVLTMGFLSYLFGVGLMLWMVWLWLRVRERRWWIGLSLASGTTLVLYFSHIIAFAIYGVVVISYELQYLIRNAQHPLKNRIVAFVRSGIPFLAPTLIYFTDFRGDTQHLARYAQPFLDWKLSAIASTLNTGASPLLLNAGGFAILIVLAMILGRIRFHWSMVFPIATLTALFFAMPTAFSGGDYFDSRIPLPIALLICASVRVDLRSRVGDFVMVSTLAVFLTLRSVALAQDFRDFDSEARQSLLLFRDIESQSVVAIAIDTTNPDYGWSARRMANWHVASLAALHAPVFVSTTHAIPSQHTMVVTKSPFTELHAWQNARPKEVGSDEQLRDVISQFRNILTTAAPSGETSFSKSYLLLLMPHTLADAAASQGVLIGKKNWFQLIQLAPNESR